MNDYGYWPNAMHVKGRSASHGARRTTAQIANEGADGFWELVTYVRRGEYMRRGDLTGERWAPVCLLRTAPSFAFRAGTPDDRSQRRLPGECRCFVGHYSAIVPGADKSCPPAGGIAGRCLAAPPK
jgi:hypothetical protein